MSSAKKRPDGTGGGAPPKAAIARLSLYLRELQLLGREGVPTVSSSRLGKLLGFTDAQVRKDLAYFGHFGHPGVGYRCDELVAAIRGILGTDRNWPIALVGVGNLGRALLGYRGFASQGFRIVAGFDLAPPPPDGQPVDPGGAAGGGEAGCGGACEPWSRVEGVPVYPMDALPQVVRGQAIELGMVAVPSAAAQRVADQLIAAGVTGILNFAPVTLALPEGISLVGVDLATDLERLTYSVVRRGGA